MRNPRPDYRPIYRPPWYQKVAFRRDKRECEYALIRYLMEVL